MLRRVLVLQFGLTEVLFCLYNLEMKNFSLFKNLILLLTFLFVSSAHAGLLYTYNQLALKDLDEVNEMINQKIKESRKESSGRSVPLKEVLQAVMSRPNEDGLLSKVLPQIRSELDRYDLYETVLGQLVDEAIFAIQHPKNFKKEAQVTYALFLNNMILELKSSSLDDGPEKKLLTKIQKAELEVSKDAQKEIKSKLMKEIPSPSKTAEAALEESKKLTEEKAKNDSEKAPQNP